MGIQENPRLGGGGVGVGGLSPANSNKYIVFVLSRLFSFLSFFFL
jgi:hypothetical protein